VRSGKFVHRADAVQAFDAGEAFHRKAVDAHAGQQLGENGMEEKNLTGWPAVVQRVLRRIVILAWPRDGQTRRRVILATLPHRRGQPECA
jgi:hypothetical protein